MGDLQAAAEKGYGTYVNMKVVDYWTSNDPSKLSLLCYDATKLYSTLYYLVRFEVPDFERCVDNLAIAGRTNMIFTSILNRMKFAPKKIVALLENDEVCRNEEKFNEHMKLIVKTGYELEAFLKQKNALEILQRML